MYQQLHDKDVDIYNSCQLNKQYGSTKKQLLQLKKAFEKISKLKFKKKIIFTLFHFGFY
jgi:hypothetical protein